MTAHVCAGTQTGLDRLAGWVCAAIRVQLRIQVQVFQEPDEPLALAFLLPVTKCGAGFGCVQESPPSRLVSLCFHELIILLDRCRGGPR